MYNHPMPDRLFRSRRSVAFIIVTSPLCRGRFAFSFEQVDLRRRSRAYHADLSQLQDRFRILFGRVIVNVANREDHDENAENQDQDCKPIKARFIGYLRIPNFPPAKWPPYNERKTPEEMITAFRII
jgi:hypothetical protein